MAGSHRCKTHPVFINPGPLTAESPPNMLAMTATVTLPDPETYHYVIDPMRGHLEYAAFGRSSFGKRGTHRVKPSVMLMTISAGEMANRFWDKDDFEQWVEANCDGDVLAQHDGYAMNWNFGCLSNGDYFKLSQRLGQPKSHPFKVDARLNKQVREWLEEQTTEYDLFELSVFGGMKGHSTYYVRDENEALHFKMRWDSVDVDRELEADGQSA